MWQTSPSIFLKEWRGWKPVECLSILSEELGFFNMAANVCSLVHLWNVQGKPFPFTCCRLVYLTAIVSDNDYRTKNEGFKMQKHGSRLMCSLLAIFCSWTVITTVFSHQYPKGKDHAKRGHNNYSFVVVKCYVFSAMITVT